MQKLDVRTISKLFIVESTNLAKTFQIDTTFLLLIKVFAFLVLGAVTESPEWCVVILEREHQTNEHRIYTFFSEFDYRKRIISTYYKTEYTEGDKLELFSKMYKVKKI